MMLHFQHCAPSRRIVSIFRSENPVRLGEWVEVRVSRTGRLASLQVENDPAQEILAPGAFTQLSLPLNLYLGGAPSPDMYSPKMKTTASFVGCIQTIVLNNREVRTQAGDYVGRALRRSSRRVKIMAPPLPLPARRRIRGST